MESPHIPISPWAAALLLIVYGLIYVLPLYGSVATRPSPTLTRNDPQVVRARIRAATLSTTLSSLSTLYLLLNTADYTLAQSLHAMGYWPLGTAESAKALLLTAILFAAPLYELFFVEGMWKDWLKMGPLLDLWNDILAWRNIIAGPVTEEVMFRSASIPILLSAGTSLPSVIFLSPLVFGMAHVHHFYEFRITNPRVPLEFAIMKSVVQFAYTSLFGAYATFIYLRTESLLAVVLVHAFCNSLGLPRFWGHVQPYWYDESAKDTKPWTWSLIYYMLLVFGAGSWWRILYTLTSNSHALALSTV